MKVPLSCFIFGVTLLFGSSVVVDSPKTMNSEWESKVLGIKYKVTTLDNAVDEMVAGLIDEIFDKAFTGRIQEEIHKHPTGKGEYLEYWPNGTLKARLPYKDGKAHGHIHGWHENGCDAFKGYFKEGLKQGIHITFNSGKYKGNIEKARLLTYNEKGKLDGEQMLSHPTGTLWIATIYKNGILNGPLEAWDVQRKYILSTLYKNGVLQAALPKNGPPPKRADMKYVDEVIHEFIQVAQREFGVTAYGTGAKMAFDVERINVSFQLRKKGSVEEARKLIVGLKERFAEIINAHEKLRPYLREFPFTPERADINLSFCNNQDLRNTDGSINHVLVGSNKNIYYFSANLLTPKKDRELQEPYAEAVKIVHGEKK
jgi:hypothetical protein